MNSVITILSATIAGIIAAIVTFWKCRKDAEAVGAELTTTKAALATAQADSAARLDELRKSVEEAKSRETEAKSRQAEVELRLTEVDTELKAALELKGRFENEATRVEEIRRSLTDRENEIAKLIAQIATLEREKTEALKDVEAANSRSGEIVAAEREATAAIVKAKDDQIAKLTEFIAQARQVITTEFKALSADALKEASAHLLRTADGIIEKNTEKTTTDAKLQHQRIETMLKPVEETIKRLDKHVEDSNVARSKAEAVLDEQVRRLAGASESLTNALRKPVVRGSWGEMTLENALESAGLEAEIDFVLQHSTDAEDGRKRTDAIVNLPKGRKLIIDSKNMMETYIALANAEDETQKVLLADVHSKSLRSHIKSLSSKEYWRRYDGLDCVILFIPHDGMYHSAIQDETEVIRDASEKRVFISNPMTLIPLLKAIRYVLDQERLNKSADEISKVGTELYVEVARFADSMAKIGSKLRQTVSAYNDAIPGLDRFIVSKSRTLKQLGSSKGADPELPEAIELEPRAFSSRELRPANLLLEITDPAADTLLIE